MLPDGVFEAVLVSAVVVEIHLRVGIFKRRPLQCGAGYDASPAHPRTPCLSPFRMQKNTAKL